MAKSFTATLSRSPGRQAWAVIFRHPIRLDPQNKPGLRVRRGLGTDVREQAQQLVDQLNELLAKKDMWTPSSRALAQRLYDERVVSAFYDKLSIETADSEELRDEFIPLPDGKDGYQHVLIVGTTGAGKTTLVRQLIGMDIRTEPFPPTSTARTTVADLELITAPGEYEVVATFLRRDHVRTLVEECLLDAALAVSREANEDAILRRILFHTAQRFRLGYLLGLPAAMDADYGDDYDENDSTVQINLDEFGQIDLVATRTALAGIAQQLRCMVEGAADDVRRAFDPTSVDDEKALAVLLAESVDKVLTGSSKLAELVEQIMSEITLRLDLLRKHGTLHHSSQGWPTSWTWRTNDRALLVRLLCLLIGNDARWFGRLLTPLVNGLRVKGPFGPKWMTEPARLVLFDGEGLGHTPDTALTIPTSVLERFEPVDAILLVDNAAQPLQAVPAGILRSLSATGFHSKLHLVFTHLDQVRGPNLPTEYERRSHVRASLDNVVRDIGTRVGVSAARVLSQRLIEHCYFMGKLDCPLDAVRLKGTVSELTRLVRVLQRDEKPSRSGPASPIYDRSRIVLIVQGAAMRFHDDWNKRLRGEHWNRVRALSRRLAEGWADHYDTLDPIGDLVRELTERMRSYLDAPLGWDPHDSSEAEKDAVLAQLARSFTMRVIELARERVWRVRLQDWGNAYAECGEGSSYRRARIIRESVYVPGVPLVTDAEDPESKAFLAKVTKIVNDVAADVGAILS